MVIKTETERGEMKSDTKCVVHTVVRSSMHAQGD